MNYKPATIQEIEEAERMEKESQEKLEKLEKLEKYKLAEVEALKKCNSYSSRQITSDPSICGGMPINGLEHGTPIQGKALTLGNKVEQIDTQVTILNGIITDINTKLFLIPPQGNTNMDKSNPLDCIDDYVNNIHCAILDANEMLTNIVNKL